MHKYIYIYILSTVKWYEGRTTQISKGRKKKVEGNRNNGK